MRHRPSPSEVEHLSRRALPVPFLVLGMGILLCALNGCGTVDKAIHRPNLVCLAPDLSRIFINDSQRGRVLIADRRFRYLSEIAMPVGSSIWGIAVSPAGELAVTNGRQTSVAFSEAEQEEGNIAEICFYTLDGRETHRLAWRGEKRLLHTPGPIRFLSDGTFVVADYELNTIVRLDRSGKVLVKFGEFGHGEGQLYYPNDLAVASDGSLLVCETYNFRLSRFTPDGTFLGHLGGKGREEGRFMFPQGLCFDAAGNLYVTELSTMRVSVFGPDGSFRQAIQPLQQGFKADCLQMFGVAWASDTGDLLVADSINECLHVIASDGRWVRAVTALE